MKLIKQILKKPFHLIAILLISLLSFLFIKSEKDNKTLKANIANIELVYQKNIDSINNKYNYEIKKQEVILFQNEEGKKKLQKYSDSIFALKKKDDRKYKETIAYYENYIKTSLPEVVYIDLDSNDIKPDTSFLSQSVKDYINNSISVPKNFNLDSQYFKISGVINKTNVALTKVEFTDSLYGRFVTKKGGLFKPDIIEYQIMNKSPYTNIEGLKSAIYKQNNKTFKKIIPATIAGIIIGILISK